MCGIAGIISSRSQPVTMVKSMLDVVRYRGPDDEGYAVFSDGNSMPRLYGGGDTPRECFSSEFPYSPQLQCIDTESEPATLLLGHRRLSIIDPSPAGHQPMASRDGRHWLIFNGEIFNCRELRTELMALGCHFFSDSDTEVILAAYQAWGADFLRRLNGMFAIVLFDQDTQSVLMARDRFGIKPLYYWVASDFVAIASEIKQFTVLPGWRANINIQRAYDFLNWNVLDHTDETLFDAVYQLGIGCMAQITMPAGGKQSFSQSDRLESKRWYSPAPQAFTGSFAEASSRFRELFFDSVRLRLRADVNVGSCLSGGLDSSSVVCAMQSILQEQDSKNSQKTFSVCFEDKAYDESQYINSVIARTNVEGNFVTPTADRLFEDLDKLVWHQDEPFGSTSIYAQWQVFRLASQHQVRVILDGQGADEILAGYRAFFAHRLASLFNQLKFITLMQEMSALKRIHGNSRWNLLCRMGDVLMPDFVSQAVRRYAGVASTMPSWLGAGFRNVDDRNPSRRSFARATTIRDYSTSQLTCSGLQMLLHWEDRNSMAHSVEARVPFLDYRLVEFVLGLPDEYKISGGVTKKVLREGLSDILPGTIKNRMDKMGFVTPEPLWIRNQHPDVFLAKINEAIDNSGGLLDDNTRKEAIQIITGKKPFNFLPWRIISFGAWLKRFEVQCS